MFIRVFATAMLPIVVLMYIIYKKDSMQPEPKSQLRKAFYLGVLSVFLSFLLSMPFEAIGLYPSQIDSVMDAIRTSFFGAAIPEEVAKFAVLWFFLRKNSYFDEKYDGIVYAACVSMGFAAFENICYLFSNIDSYLSVGIKRAIFAVPGHLCDGIMMGYYYSLVKFYPKSKHHTKNCIMVLLVPILLHGLYDAMLMMIKPAADSVLWLMVICVVFIVFCFKTWKYAARRIEEHLARDMKLGNEEERKKSLAVFRRLALERPKMFEPELADALACMGDFYKEADRKEEAEAMYNEAFNCLAECKRKYPGGYDEDMAIVKKNLGGLYYAMGDYERSREALTNALALFSSIEAKTERTMEHQAEALNLLEEMNKESEPPLAEQEQ